MSIRIHGVHPIQAPEPCHLIEVEFDLPPLEDVWAEFTQEDPGKPRENWQVAYDEEPLAPKRCRWSFYFHYIDFAKPLHTPDGPIPLPEPTPVPQHLRSREYWPP